VALLTWWRRSPAGREAEIVFLRQQLIVLKRTARVRPRLKATDRLTFVCLLGGDDLLLKGNDGIVPNIRIADIFQVLRCIKHQLEAAKAHEYPGLSNVRSAILCAQPSSHA
jgi:hypothetical protein